MGSKIIIVGEAWGREEAEEGLPFVGTSGKMLRGMLRQVGIEPTECFLTNVFNFQPKGKFPDNDLKNITGLKTEGIPGYPALVKGKFALLQYQPELDRLYREIRIERPDLIIALGATAVWALMKVAGIKKVRGAPSLVDESLEPVLGYRPKVLPTYHPTAVMREFKLRPIVIADLAKARKESEFPELRRPKREIWIEPTLDDLLRFEHDFILPSPDLSVDIETAGRQITCVGFAPSPERAIVVPFVDALQRDGNYWRSLADEQAAWRIVRRWCQLAKRGAGQNFLYDTNFLWTEYGITFPNMRMEDTMLMHHALQPEMEKGLGFLATIYTEELPWKFMRAKHETIKKED